MNTIIIQLIKAYQFFLSPDHSFWARALGKHHCRYYPTCSMYSRECYERFGFFLATWLTLKRLIRCNPWSPGGTDLVPDIANMNGKNKNCKK